MSQTAVVNRHISSQKLQAGQYVKALSVLTATSQSYIFTPHKIQTLPGCDKN